MDLPPPSPEDPPERLYAQARALYEACQAKDAVIQGVKAYVGPWMTDKRMKILGGMLLREIERLEKAAAGRAPPPR